jgi:hypothetical protein
VSHKWRKQVLPILSSLLITLSLARCSEPAACTADIRPAVAVTVQDAQTQDYLGVEPRGVARDGNYQDSLRVWSTTLTLPPQVVSLAAADERRGVYTVELEADGYEPWDTAGVLVSSDECHVRTATFTAFLQPVP